MSECFGRICHDFSFSSHTAKISFKAALATCLSIYLSLLLNFQDPFFAGFGCFLMLLPSSAAVLERAYQAVIGAIFGGGLGYFILGFFINDHFLFTLGIFATISVFSYLMSMTKNSFFWYYALVNLLLVAISGAVNPASSLDVMFFRIANVTLGIFCYVLVAVIVFPDFTEKGFQKKFRKIHKEVYLLVSDVLRQYLSGEYSEVPTMAKMDMLVKELAVLEEQLDELKKEERIFGVSNMHFDIRLVDLKKIATDLRDFYEYASSAEHRNCSFQRNFTANIKNVISIAESAASFDYSHRHPYAIRLLSLLAGFDSGKEKELYQGKKDEYRSEDVLIFLECLLLCKSLIPMEHHAAISRNDDLGTACNTEDFQDDDCAHVNLHLFGRKIFSMDLMLAKFAMKSALAVITDFWLYFWFEIPGSPTTIAISAITVTRPDIITTRHRSILRIAGCLAGVMLSFAFLAFGIQTTEIMFACLFIVAFISGLIWIGDTGIAYFGYQMIIAFMFSVIPDSMPALDVTEPTQRAVAIALGVIVAWFVMTFVFPENLPRDFFRRFRKIRDRLKGNLSTIANTFSSHNGDVKPVSANFAVEKYNSLLSFLMIVKEHREISPEDAEDIRLFVIGCIKIHRELDNMSRTGRDVVEYLKSVDPDFCKNIMCVVSDAICLENGVEKSVLKTRMEEISESISRFEKIQRDKKLLFEKDTDFKAEVAHVLLSLKRMLDYSRSLIAIIPREAEAPQTFSAFSFK